MFQSALELVEACFVVRTVGFDVGFWRSRHIQAALEVPRFPNRRVLREGWGSVTRPPNP